MDFFETQSDTKRESLMLKLAFSAVFLACFAIVYWLAALTTTPFEYFFPTLNSDLVHWGIVTAFTVVLVHGCYVRWKDVSSGGEQLALRLGATPITRHTNDRAHKLFLNLVEEMSVAATIPAPNCFVMNSESAINAFVAGTRECTVLVVTQGTIEKLDVDELRGVIAHEIAHIANDDISTSMKLLIAIGGLNAISVAGRACFSTWSLFPDRKPDTNLLFSNSIHRQRPTDNAFIVVVAISIVSSIAGITLCTLGWIFTLLGQVLKAAFSRKREELADAKAVQFTRDSWGIASALNKIASNEHSRGLHSRYSEDVAHMCIDGPTSLFLFPNWMATHPPIESRILSIEPYFKIKQRKSKNGNTVDATKAKQGATRTIVKPDAVTTASKVTLHNSTTELSILFSLMIQSSGYNNDANEKKFAATLKCYTNDSPIMRQANEPGIEEEFKRALDTLYQLPAAQRQNLLDHIAELVDHDGIQTKEEASMLSHIYNQLNPLDKAA